MQQIYDVESERGRYKKAGVFYLCVPKWRNNPLKPKRVQNVAEISITNVLNQHMVQVFLLA